MILANLMFLIAGSNLIKKQLMLVWLRIIKYSSMGLHRWSTNEMKKSSMCMHTLHSRMCCFWSIRPYTIRHNRNLSLVWKHKYNVNPHNQLTHPTFSNCYSNLMSFTCTRCWSIKAPINTILRNEHDDQIVYSHATALAQIIDNLACLLV
mgnify:CR=1 FL=1